MTHWHNELARRMAGPQRHRLLHGYPMLPLMRPAASGAETVRHADGSVHSLQFSRRAASEDSPPREPAWVTLDHSRPLLVGILPHTQCNPQLEGCGFCSFPHDAYDKRVLRLTAREVADQIEDFFAIQPEFLQRRVDSVYFGGATANLTPKSDLLRIAQALSSQLDLTEAEVTLEGVPTLFRSLLRSPLDALLEMPARQRRISMGVQTFDEPMLRSMGRARFGSRRVVEQVVEKAHKRQITTSGDFLINLPSESRQHMLQDMEQAMALGFDQVCVYHLLLAENMGTPWAESEEIRRALPSVPEACDNWLSVREALLAGGYRQTSLTNFERAEIHESQRGFVYEEHSFTPELYDALGFGPLAISSFMDIPRRRAVKLVRSKSYIGTLWGDEDLYFPYSEEDLRLLFLTRGLARLRVLRAPYREVFGADVSEHFAPALEAAREAGLVALDQEELRLTPRGMFYADSVVGLLAHQRAHDLRATSAGCHTRDLLKQHLLLGSFMG